MYLGIREEQYNIYVDKSLRSGIRYARRHAYRCEHCGEEHLLHIDFPAADPFYCDCNRLVGVTLPTAAPEVVRIPWIP